MVTRYGVLYFDGGQVGNYEVFGGATITAAIADAIALAATDPTGHASFTFNGVDVTVEPDSNPVLILRDWQRGMSGYVTTVGPHPAAELSPQELASDQLIERENQRRRDLAAKAAAAAARTRRDAVEARLAFAPPMELLDEQPLATVRANASTKSIATYAERWARLMQLDMANGKTLEDVAEATSHEADLEGMSGFTYGIAVQLLAQSWIHGDQLRRWHNLATQIGHEGERANEAGTVLNPALLTIEI